MQDEWTMKAGGTIDISLVYSFFNFQSVWFYIHLLIASTQFTTSDNNIFLKMILITPKIGIQYIYIYTAQKPLNITMDNEAK